MITTIRLESKNDFDLGEVIRELDIEFDDGREAGLLSLPSGQVEWRIEEGEVSLVKIDRRQKKAAALLLMGFDLPQPMLEAANSMMIAARICPGLTTHEVMDSNTRKEKLLFARKLIDEMLGEI